MRRKNKLQALLLLGVVGVTWGQMPKGLAGRDSYAIRNIEPETPCRFASDYARLKGNKADARVPLSN